MGGLGMWLRAEARKRWRSWLAVAIIAGVGWGAVLTAVAGARRTNSAFPRFLAYSHAADVLVTPEQTGSTGFNDAVAKLPEVAAAAPLAGMNAFVTDPTPRASFQFGAPFFPLDTRLGREVNRPKIFQGRLPSPTNPREMFVSPSFVDQLKVGVGEWVTFQTGAEVAPGGTRRQFQSFRIRIVGVGVTQSEAFPITVFDRVQPLAMLTPAAYRLFNRPESDAFDGVAIRLKPGAKLATFKADAERLLSRFPAAGSELFVSSEADRPGIVGRAMRPQVSALLAFALALGVTLLLVMTQTLARQILIQSADYPALRALGLGPRRLVVASVAPAMAAGVLAASIAVGVAIAASPLTPVGAARVAEPSPGIAADWFVLGLGVTALVLFFVAGALLPAWRAARAAARTEAADDLAARSRVAERLARAGLPAHAAAGVRMALEPGRGRTAAPVRTVILSAIVSVLGLSAAFTFGASLDRAVSTPAAFGQRWDRAVDAQFADVESLKIPVNDPSYAAVAGGAYSPGVLVVNGTAVPAIAIDQIKGTLFPTLLEGRPPRAADEVVLGTSTLRQLHAQVGGTVRVTRAGTTVPMRVVGRAVFPAFGVGAFTPTELGQGAALTVTGLGGQTFLEPGQHSFYLIRLAPHPTAQAVKRIDSACGPVDVAGGLCVVFKNQLPPEFESYVQVRGVPWILAALLAALAAATLAHGLLATVRRRRRDLAVFKTLGFVRRQVSGAVAWQASTMAVVALIGIPLGVVAGRWGWTTLASQLGIAANPRVPILTVALTIPAGVLLANLAAALPARAAAGTQAAIVLRTE